jgi:hypothetical protein
MGDNAGYNANYYRNANNGHPLGGGNMATVVVQQPNVGYYPNTDYYGGVRISGSAGVFVGSHHGGSCGYPSQQSCGGGWTNYGPAWMRRCR